MLKILQAIGFLLKLLLCGLHFNIQKSKHKIQVPNIQKKRGERERKGERDLKAAPSTCIYSRLVV